MKKKFWPTKSSEEKQDTCFYPLLPPHPPSHPPSPLLSFIPPQLFVPIHNVEDLILAQPPFHHTNHTNYPFNNCGLFQRVWFYPCGPSFSTDDTANFCKKLVILLLPHENACLKNVHPGFRLNAEGMKFAVNSKLVQR